MGRIEGQPICGPNIILQPEGPEGLRFPSREPNSKQDLPMMGWPLLLAKTSQKGADLAGRLVHHASSRCML
jgi:hypothetical protein